MNIKDRLEQLQAFDSNTGCILTRADARKVLALYKAACLTLCACVDLQDKGDGSLVSPARLALTNALAAMEAE